MAVVNDILTGIQSDNVIPSSCNSFSEAAMYVIESAEDEFNQLFEESGLVDDNGVMTEDTDVLNEGISDAKDRAVEVLKNLWAKIKEWFEKVIKWFTDRCDQAKEFLARVKAKAESKLDEKRQAKVEKKLEKIDTALIPDDAKLGKINKGFELIGLNKGFNNDAPFAALKSVNNAESTDEVDNIIKALPGKLCGKEGVTVSGMRTEIRNKNIKSDKIDVDGKFFKTKYSAIADVVLHNQSMKDLKESYNTARKLINECIKDAQALKKEEKKAKNTDGVKSAARKISGFKSVNQILHAAHGVQADVLRLRYSEFMKILSAAVRESAKAEAKKKKDEKKAQNASTEFEALFGF